MHRMRKREYMTGRGSYQLCLSISPIQPPNTQYSSRTLLCRRRVYASPSSMGILLPTHQANRTASPRESSRSNCSSNSLSRSWADSQATLRRLWTKHRVKYINSFVERFSGDVFARILVVKLVTISGGGEVYIVGSRSGNAEVLATMYPSRTDQSWIWNLSLPMVSTKLRPSGNICISRISNIVPYCIKVALDPVGNSASEG